MDSSVKTRIIQRATDGRRRVHHAARASPKLAEQPRNYPGQRANEIAVSLLRVHEQIGIG
jgi:hypothetical protein